MADAGSYKYSQLFTLAKCVSSLSHRSSASERGFYINCSLLGAHGHSASKKTLKSIRLVRDKICCFEGVLKFPVRRDLISSVKCVHAKYVADIKKECEKKEKT